MSTIADEYRRRHGKGWLPIEQTAPEPARSNVIALVLDAPAPDQALFPIDSIAHVFDLVISTIEDLSEEDEAHLKILFDLAGMGH